MTPERLRETLLAELLSVVALRFGDAVRVEGERVPWGELAFREAARPVFEEPNHGSGGFQPLHAIVVPEHERRQVTAVHVPQAARPVVVLGEEQSRIGSRGGALE